MRWVALITLPLLFGCPSMPEVRPVLEQCIYEAKPYVIYEEVVVAMACFEAVKIDFTTGAVIAPEGAKKAPCDRTGVAFSTQELNGAIACVVRNMAYADGYDGQ